MQKFFLVADASQVNLNFRRQVVEHRLERVNF